MNKSNLHQLVFLSFILSSKMLFAQGTGSMTDFENVFENKNLISFTFNGKTYAPRHVFLPKEEFEFVSPDGNSRNACLTRGVQLYVKEANNDWVLATPNPMFISTSAGGLLEVELSLFSKEIGGSAQMIPINSTYFVLFTTYRVKVTGQTGNVHYPIFFLFRTVNKAGYFPIEWDSFQPTPSVDNKLVSFDIQAKKITFNMSNGKKVWLTFDPMPNYKVGWEDSDGNYSVFK